MSVLIKAGSVTNAQRARKVLSAHGYQSILSRLENPRSGDGCGYVLSVGTDSKDAVLRLLDGAGVRVLGVEDL